jgi:hypothetical protein
MSSDKPLVFVSCGQHSDSEKQLGKNICSLLEEVRPDVTPYFAEYQSTAEGLSNQILKALHRAACVICVMHPRGVIEAPDGRTVTRGSVWVEQEVAITAFMNHVLDRSIPLLFYKRAGVSIEGIRSVLLLNPRVEFTDESEVLQDLRSILPTVTFIPFASYDVVPLLTYRRIAQRSDGNRHTYELTADVKNVGTERVTDFEIRVFFPRAFLNLTAVSGDRKMSTASHICLTANAKRAPDGLYPGDGMRNPLTIDYYMDHDLHDDPRAMAGVITVELYSGRMKPKIQTFPIRDFQEF